MHSVDDNLFHRGGTAMSPVGTVFALSATYAVVLLAGAVLTGASVGVAAAVFLVAVSLVAVEVRRTYPHTRFGFCNGVTLARLAMVAFFSGAVVAASATPAWVVFTVAVLALLLDGVDGWLARRSGLVSDFGARFDMETDSAFAAVLALWLLATGLTGPEILVLGFTRYAFVLVACIVPALRGDLPHSFRRKVICVFQIGGLIALVCPLTWPELYRPIALAASALVLLSFAVDSRYLLRAAR